MSCSNDAAMDWTGSPARIPSRLRDPLPLPALVLQRQRDAAGLVVFDDRVRTLLPARVRRGHWHAIARALATTDAGTGTAAAPALRQVVGMLRRRGMVVLISDLLLERDIAITALRYLRHRGHQVLVLHIADPLSSTSTGRRGTLRDPETGRAVTLAHGVGRVPRHRRRRGRAWVRHVACRYSLRVVPTDLPWLPLAWTSRRDRLCGAAGPAGPLAASLPPAHSCAA